MPAINQSIIHASGVIMTSHSNSDCLPPIQDDEFLPPISRWTTVSGVVVVVIVGIAFALASVVKYKVTVKGQANIRPVGELRLVQAATEGPVMNIAVKENQRVKQGDVIATIDSSQLQTKKSQLQSTLQQSRLQLVQIDAQISALNRQSGAETNRTSRAVGSAEADLKGRRREHQNKQVVSQSEVEEAKANLGAVKAALNAAQLKRDRYLPIAASGAISKNQLEEAQLEVTQQEQAVEAARAKLQSAQAALNPTDAEVAIATERIAQESASGQVNLATLAKDREALLQQRIEISKQLERDDRELQQVEVNLRQTTLMATADGTISKLNLRNSGQMVRPGEEIAQIVPSNALLQVKAVISPDERNKLQEGQTVQMRVSACPYPDYGVLKGVVSQISQDTLTLQENRTAATDPTASSPNGNAATSFYRVTIEPESLSLGQGKNQCALQSGMEGSVDIISREETVLRFVLRKARLIADL